MLTDNEQQELREQSEYGHKAQAVHEFLADFLLNQRAQVINRLETDSFDKAEDLVNPIIYLRTLRLFELEVEKFISLGEIAERKLNEDGE
ncbi:MAG: hypothetical protein IJR35_11670 [Synergistaceae bacterium]|nr:hypothetical protein [Synergistaceae bacterium]